MNKTYETIVSQRNLGLAIQQMRHLIESRQLTQFIEPLNEIQADHSRILEFMLSGFADPSRNQLYTALLRQLFRLRTEIILTLSRRTESLSSPSPYPIAQLSHDDLRSHLEAFVQDLALLSLETDGESRSKNLYQSHHQLMTALFYHVLTASPWSRQTQTFFQELLLSPAIDTLDAQLLVSAITLSLLIAFDDRRFAALLYLYQYATDVAVKQRALVGWTLTLPGEEATLFPELVDLLGKVVSPEAVKRELLELQLQLLYGMDAERDTQQISRDILPGILQSRALSLGGAEDAASLDDILDPHAAEQAMEKLEASYTRMMDLQRKGVDVYFGGFSQMKQFPFFRRINNWFCPFSPNHPEIKPIAGVDKEKFLQNIFSQSPFCNSDKYSFVLALSMVIDRIPQNIRELISGDHLFQYDNAADYQDQPAYLRRLYLQDLYRFFRVCPLRSPFTNPFGGGTEETEELFLLNPLLKKTVLPAVAKDLGIFLLRRKKYSFLYRLTQQAELPTDRDSIFLRAAAAEHHAEHRRAQALYTEILALHPDDLPALRACARTALRAADFPRAIDCYRRLCHLHPDTTAYALGLATALIKDGQTQEAAELLFKLDYQHPADAAIRRALAWVELFRDQPHQAYERYAQLLAEEDATQTDDFLHAAYSLWFAGRIEPCVQHLRQYLERRKTTAEDAPAFLQQVFREDAALLSHYHLTQTDENLLIDLLLR